MICKILFNIINSLAAAETAEPMEVSQSRPEIFLRKFELPTCDNTANRANAFDYEGWRAPRRRMDEISQNGLNALLGELKNTDPNVRIYVAQKIGRMGQDAKAALPALLSALDADGEEWFVRVDIIRAIGNIGDKDVIPRLSTLLKDNELGVRMAAQDAIKRIDHRK